MHAPTLLAACALLFPCPVSAASAAAQDAKQDDPKTAPTLAERVRSSPQHTTLARLLAEADLLEPLGEKGATTLFAPTDAAFQKLERERRGALRELSKKENRARLVRLLSQHVVDGKLAAADVAKLKHATTLSGQRIDVTVERGRGLRVDGAKLERADVVCANGVLHVVDTLLVPEQRGLVGTLRATGKHGVFLSLVEAAGLTDVLEDEGPFTLFAPTDVAFAAMPEGTVDRLRQPGSRAVVASLVRNHMLAGRVYADQAAELEKVRTLAERDLPIEFDERRALVKGVRVVRTDGEAANGVAHVIDTLLLPR
ncbi:MAG: fasciclin domain-containing protein [Planctomycetota bacterium]